MALLVNVDPAVARSGLEPTVREDLTDRIVNATPISTVKFKMCSRSPTSQKRFDWGHDSLNPSEVITTAQLDTESRFEGQDWGNFRTIQQRIRLFNFCGIQSEEVDVTRTMLKTDIAGVTNELTLQTEKAYKELAFKMEKHLSWGIGDSGGDGTNFVDGDQNDAGTRKRRTHGIYSTIAMTGLAMAHGTADAIIDYQAGAGNILTLPRARNCTSWFRDLNITAPGTWMTLDQLYSEVIIPATTNGFVVENAMCFSGLMGRKIFGTFATDQGPGRAVLNQRTIPAETMRLIDRIDYITTPYGTFFIAYDQQLNPRDPTLSVTWNAADYSSNATGGNHTAPRNECFFMLQPEYFRIRMLDGVNYQNLPNFSDGVKVALVTEWGHEFTSPVFGCGAMNYWAPAA